MENMLYKGISAGLLLISIAWTGYTFFSSWGTDCFDAFKTNITLISIIANLLWNNILGETLFKPKVREDTL